MSQNTRTKGLVIITALAVVAFVIGFITLKDNDAAYEIPVEAALEALEEGKRMIGLDQAQKSAEAENTVLIDLRTKVEFNQGHLTDALNIPFADLLSETSRAFFQEEGQKFILYGNNASQSSNAWILLQQIGVTDVQFIPGNYDVVANTVEEVPLDMAAHDYKAVFDEVQKKELEAISVAKVTKPAPKPKVIIPTKRPEKKRLEGC